MPKYTKLWPLTTLSSDINNLILKNSYDKNLKGEKD